MFLSMFVGNAIIDCFFRWISSRNQYKTGGPNRPEKNDKKPVDPIWHQNRLKTGTKTTKNRSRAIAGNLQQKNDKKPLAQICHQKRQQKRLKTT